MELIGISFNDMTAVGFHDYIQCNIEFTEDPFKNIDFSGIPFYKYNMTSVGFYSK